MTPVRLRDLLLFLNKQTKASFQGPGVDTYLADKEIEQLTALVQSEMVRIGKLIKNFPGYALIRKVAVAREKWTIDNGMITPTLKLKRNVIFQKYANAINDMYKGHVL